jgi:tRNA pseudouridine38-40 synthase
MNFKLLIQYDGTDFHGWQIQDGLRTVQGELTAALSLIDGRDVVVHGSGRTDAGVHAEGQVGSVVLERQISGDKLRAAINGNVGRDLRILRAEQTADDFHARYSALGKSYVYRIFNAPAMSPFWVRYALHEARQLDLARMQECGHLFVGEHDWTAFSAQQSDVEDRVRTISALEVEAFDDSRGHGRMIQITVSANGFLRYMVRTIAGALLATGRGELDCQDVSQAVEGGKRPTAAVTAPAGGLTLLSVRY